MKIIQYININKIKLINFTNKFTPKSIYKNNFNFTKKNNYFN